MSVGSAGLGRNYPAQCGARDKNCYADPKNSTLN